MSSAPATGQYPGNPSLPREVREKILSTFRHTLNLYHQGKTDDCVIGCDFILKMDPRFAPARKLMDKAKNPAADVNVAELETLVTATPTRQERVAAIDPEKLLVRAVESYNARDFDAAIAAAEQVLAVLPGNRDALQILDKAGGKKAAQPLFDASRQRAIAALERNRGEEARQELERMRSLDPDHPAVALLERRIGGSEAATRGPMSTGAPATPRPPTSEEIRFDIAAQPLSFEGLGGETREPEIHFGAGATMSPNVGVPAGHSSPPAKSQPAESYDSALDALSLDSLSLDAPVVSPPSPAIDPEATNPGRLARPAPPAPPPGSPADFWSTGPGEVDLEPVPEPPPASASPTPPAPVPLVSDEEETRASRQEIAALMRQGDEMARRGDRQQAIEIWSRIFLIDINNAEAVNRIEKTRQEMAEGNKVISENLKTGREKYEAGDLGAARELFLQVLAVDENEPTARYYVDRIEEELARPAAMAAPSGKAEAGTGFGDVVPTASPATAAPPPQLALKLPVPPRVVALVGVALIASAVGVYLVLKSPRRPPASKTGPPPAVSAGSLARARELSQAGQTAEARRELLRVPPNSPDYAEARQMLAEMGKASTPEQNAANGVLSTTPGAVSGPAPASSGGEPARLRAAAEQALAEKRYIEALKNFNLAGPAFRNDPTFAQSMGVASDKVQALAPAVKLYNEAEYEAAIPFLWRIYQEDRENQDARSYLLRSYYNQGVTLLQNGLFSKAMQSFDEALALDPKDSEIIRHRKFAEHYLKGDLDLMGRIYVRHLTHRP